jgi:hypothetical protein
VESTAPPQADSRSTSIDRCALNLARIVAASFLVSIALSAKLWTSSLRQYPMCPVWSSLNVVLPTADCIILAFLGACLLLVFLRASVLCARIAVVTSCALCLLDQTRIQPWAFQYILMLSGFAFLPSTQAGRENFVSACRFMVPLIYFWSGLHKLNPFYPTETFPWLISGITHGAVFNTTMVYAVAVSSAAVEIFIGIGLLFKPTRKAALVLCLLMHLIILLCIGPAGLNWNMVVWPWNFAMIGIVILLFARYEQPFSLNIFPINNTFGRAIIAAVAIFPLLSFFDAWDSYLSFSLYSGTNAQGTLSLSDTTFQRLPDDLKLLTTKTASGRHLLTFQAWCLSKLNVPPYPEERVYKRISEDFAHKYARQAGDVMLVIRQRPDCLRNRRDVKSTDVSLLDGP